MSGKDILYVGKSKNGIDNRPVSHEDKNTEWSYCYVLTNHKENTFLHDGAVQYIENAICERINELDNRYDNKTKQTSGETVNQNETAHCDRYINECYDMLFCLGLDLYENAIDNKETNINENHIISPKNESLYKKLVNRVKILNSDIIFTPTKVYIKATIDKKILFTMECTGNKLDLVFNAPIGSLEDKKSLLEDVSEKGKHGVGNYRLKINDDSYFDEIIDFVNQIINL